MYRILRAVWRTFSVCVVILIVLTAILFVGTQLFGLRSYPHLQDDMEPAIRKGSLILARPVSGSELAPGDVIVFRPDGGTVTAHRIDRLASDGSRGGSYSFYTKSDRGTPDPEAVYENNVIGIVVAARPYLGFVSGYVSHAPGLYFAAIAMVLAIVGLLLPEPKKARSKP